MRIRPLTTDDIPAYVVLRRDMLRAEPWAFAASEEADVGCDEAKMRERIGEPGQCLVGAFDTQGEQGAQPGAPLVGAAGLVRNRHAKMAHRATVWGVYVAPRVRGMGVGAELINALIAAAQAMPGVDSVALSVSERSTAAQRLYERCGFVAWGREPSALRLVDAAYDEIHMVRML